jgi:predicted phosphodiesterase
MRVALFSDIHSNLLALQGVLKDIRCRQVDHLICLGDIVGYNAKPAECLKLVQETGADVVIGNHDVYASNDVEMEWYNPVARAGLEYSRAKLLPSQKKWLVKLPQRRDYKGFTVVHATLDHPEEWDYVTTLESAARHFEFQEEKICFIGHTHQVRVHRIEDQRVRSIRVPAILTLKKNVRYLINVGSVGQPRDRNPKASYVIYDTDRQTVEFQRVTYPALKAADEVLNAGLPPFLALRLLKGV